MGAWTHCPPLDGTNLHSSCASVAGLRLSALLRRKKRLPTWLVSALVRRVLTKGFQPVLLHLGILEPLLGRLEGR